ncbi:hypothetical protein AGMMS49936_09040 [Endomicrobiia bacterium]|nr:hypothetical protein AGMMS49936_09040 [Endomicrobiia bacterium]
MKIEKIEKIKFKEDMFRLFFVNSESLMVFADTVVRFGLKQELDISENDYKDLVAYDKLNMVMSDALLLVSKRSYSSKGLQAKLMQKGYKFENVVKAVKRLEELGYINDEKFSKVYTDYLLQKGKGEFAIKFELEKRGIEKSLINDALKSVKTELEPYGQIIKILKTKFKDFDDKDKKKTRRAASFF